MLEQLRYRNHLGEEYNFGKEGVFVNMNELHNYEWSITKKNNRIAALDYSVQSRKLPVIIICENEEKGIQARNKLLEVAEKDVLSLQHGKVFIGDYYFRCYVTKSTKKEYLTSKRYMKAELTLTSDFPYWVRESEYVFRKIGEVQDDSKDLDFAFDHPFDFFPGIGSKKINNTDFISTNFKMAIHGKVENPLIRIGGHIYQVNCTVEEGEVLTIDSISKKIILTAADGTEVNKFAFRNKDSYIFEKIKPGANTVLWTGLFRVDVTLLEERSEPRWT